MTIDLSTTYLGFELRNPVIASAGPLTGNIDSLRALEDAGVAAVVLPSLFQEQVEHEEIALHQLREFGAESSGEAVDYFPELPQLATGTDAYLDLIDGARRALGIPIIGSLNGCSDGGWAGFAREIVEAGADAIELNVYIVPADPLVPGEEIERRYVQLVGEVRAAVKVPIAVKIGPYFSALPNLCSRLVAAGADGLVIFNRYLQPDVDLETLRVVPRLELSTPAEARLALQWIGILHGRIDASLAHSTGIHTAEDAVRALLVGADVTMMTSALLMHGPDWAARVIEGVGAWFEEHEYASVRQAVGSLSRLKGPDPDAFERANYMRTLASWGGENI